MLKKHYRLKRNTDFRKVFAGGRSSANKYFVIYHRPNLHNCLRIGFSVSKRIGGAVVRNRAKRILREAMRKHVCEIETGQDIVLIARNPIKGIKSTEIEQNLVKVLGKMRLLKQASK